MGDRPGERPLSEFSVLNESVLGEATRFQPKKDETLPPGVWGFFASLADSDSVEEDESILSGGGLIVGFKAILLYFAESSLAPLPTEYVTVVSPRGSAADVSCRGGGG